MNDYTIYRIIYNVHYTTMYSKHRALYNVHYTVNIIHYTVNNVRFTVHTELHIKEYIININAKSY